MPVRWKSKKGRRARVAVTLDAAIGAIEGTVSAASVYSGRIQGLVYDFTGALTGVFVQTSAVAGSIITQLDHFGGTIYGSEDYPAVWSDGLSNEVPLVSGQPFSYTFTATDPDGDPIEFTWDADLVPSWLTITAMPQVGNSRDLVMSSTTGAPEPDPPTIPDSYAVTVSLVDANAVNVGDLTHDGPATPEQISLWLPITGTVGASATATVTVNGVAAHPLFRLADAFTGVVTGLTPGTTYSVAVTVTDGTAQTTVGPQNFTTRSLPASYTTAAGPTITIPAGSSSAQVQTYLNQAVPGSVVQFQDGTYTVSGLLLTKSGTEAQPIYIRGTTRAGTVLSASSGNVFYCVRAADVVIENMTLQGPAVDGINPNYTHGLRIWDTVPANRVTVRNVTMTGVDRGVYAPGANTGCLVYDCTLVGNNQWNLAWLLANTDAGRTVGNRTWNDDGLMLAGQGNCAFNNTLSGFGDSFAVNQYITNVGVHFYRNKVLFSCDDGAELDYATRNVTLYDNHLSNVMTAFSADPITTGPTWIFRNVWVNVARQTFKINSVGKGLLIYNNTIIRQVGVGDYPNTVKNPYSDFPLIVDQYGAQDDFAYCNNLLVWSGALGPANTSGRILKMEGVGWKTLDANNNGWYPNGLFSWPDLSGASLAAIQAATDTSTRLFGSVERHTGDVICESNPFASSLPLGASWDVQVETTYTPTLAPTSVCMEAGMVIPGVTDGFSTAAPHIGAIIAGRSVPQWGDRT